MIDKYRSDRLNELQGGLLLTNKEIVLSGDRVDGSDLGRRFGLGAALIRCDDSSG